MLKQQGERLKKTLTKKKKKEKHKSLTSNPLTLQLNNPNVSQRLRKEKRKLYNDP